MSEYSEGYQAGEEDYADGNATPYTVVKDDWRKGYNQAIEDKRFKCCGRFETHAADCAFKPRTGIKYH